jgi:hypothetical protein
MFPGWFAENDEPNESLGDVTLMNNNTVSAKDSQTPAEYASKRPPERSPQVPQLEFENFAAEVIAGLDSLDPQTRELVRSCMELVYGNCGSLRFEIEAHNEELRRNRGELVCGWAESELEEGLNGNTPYPDDWIDISKEIHRNYAGGFARSIQSRRYNAGHCISLLSDGSV